MNTKKKKSTEDGPNCLFTLTTCSNKSLVWGPINRSRVIPIRWDKYKASPFRALIRRLDPQIVARWESRRANTAEEIEIAAQTSTPEGGVTRYSCSFALPLFFVLPMEFKPAVFLFSSFFVHPSDYLLRFAELPGGSGILLVSELTRGVSIRILGLWITVVKCRINLCMYHTLIS